MRDYRHIDRYLDELSQDIYKQPADKGHINSARKVINEFASHLPANTTVLDVGCGEGFAQPMFEFLNMKYCGICLGDDFEEAKRLGRNVYEMDFSFTTFPDNNFDLIFSRHSLEHSPIPLLTLMEWHRIAKNWLLLVLPNPEYYGWFGRNHYFLMENLKQIRWWLRRSGWEILRHKKLEDELWFFCQKLPRISYEGYEEAPLSNSAYEAERDLK